MRRAASGHRSQLDASDMKCKLAIERKLLILLEGVRESGLKSRSKQPFRRLISRVCMERNQKPMSLLDRVSLAASLDSFISILFLFPSWGHLVAGRLCPLRISVCAHCARSEEKPVCVTCRLHNAHDGDDSCRCVGSLGSFSARRLLVWQSRLLADPMSPAYSGV